MFVPSLLVANVNSFELTLSIYTSAHTKLSIILKQLLANQIAAFEGVTHVKKNSTNQITAFEVVDHTKTSQTCSTSSMLSIMIIILS